MLERSHLYSFLNCHIFLYNSHLIEFYLILNIGSSYKTVDFCIISQGL